MKVNYPTILFLLISLLTFKTFHAQSFINGDLEGPNPTGPSQLPSGWTHVPLGDPTVSLATNTTADLLSLTEPSAINGMFGTPFSGLTFMGAVRGSNGTTTWVFHESIMQTVYNLIPDSIYTLTFHQAVVKTKFHIDTSGSWAVYKDYSLIGVTTPTSSTITYDNPNLNWEERTMSFKATSNSHTFKFVSEDDDANDLMEQIEGSLYMGIDSISISRIEITSSIGTIEPELEISYFPNPTKDNLTIKSQKKISSADISVYNTIGEIVLLKKVNIDPTYILDVSTLPFGLYFLEISHANKITQNRFIKN